MKLKQKDILGIKELDIEDIMLILETAKDMKMIIDSDVKKVPYLTGKTIITLFYENSTRTRMSFELAAKMMSGNAANISTSSSSVKKGETLIDTGKTLDMMGTDIIIIRHGMSGAAQLLAKNVEASVINAGDGMHEHPTQALLDMFTIYEHYGTLKDLKIAIVGDIYHSRVARSNVIGMQKLGAKVYLAGPSTLVPKEMQNMGATICPVVAQAVNNADVVMGLRIQLERQKNALFPSQSEYSKFYGVNKEMMQYAKPNCVIMHPGPVNRGLELTTDLIDGKNSLINEQVKNGVVIRMALLYLLAGRKDK